MSGGSNGIVCSFKVLVDLVRVILESIRCDGIWWLNVGT